MEGLILTGLAGKLLYDIAGPFVKDLGEMLKDELRPYRAIQQKRLAEKTVRMLQAAKIEAKPVSPKLLVRIFDEGGLEDDDGLHTMWSCLLANAAGDSNSVTPAFTEILSQLSKYDALFLEDLFAIGSKTIAERHKKGISFENNHLWQQSFGDRGNIFQLFNNVFFSRKLRLPPVDTFSISIDNLLRLRILKEEIDLLDAMKTFENGEPHSICTEYEFTPLGSSFMAACQPPKKRRPVSKPK